MVTVRMVSKKTGIQNGNAAKRFHGEGSNEEVYGGRHFSQLKKTYEGRMRRMRRCKHVSRLNSQ
jgi:hypothetical protein